MRKRNLKIVMAYHLGLNIVVLVPSTKGETILRRKDADAKRKEYEDVSFLLQTRGSIELIRNILLNDVNLITQSLINSLKLNKTCKLSPCIPVLTAQPELCYSLFQTRKRLPIQTKNVSPSMASCHCHH